MGFELSSGEGLYEVNCVYTPFCEDYGPSYQVMIEFGQDLLQKYFVRI